MYACCVAVILSALTWGAWFEHSSSVRRAQARRLHNRDLTSCTENSVAFEIGTHRIGLLTCAGTAGQPPTPVVSMGIGDHASIGGLSGAETITATSTRFLTVNRYSLTAVAAGTTVLRVHDYPCWSSDGAPQLGTCDLVRVVTTG